MNTKLLLANVCIVFLLPISTLSAQRITLEGSEIVMDASGMKRATISKKLSEEVYIDITTPKSNAQVYHKLQIARENGGPCDWEKAVGINMSSICAEGWRVPTQREMVLMMILKDDINYFIGRYISPSEELLILDGEYWTATTSQVNSSWAWMVNTRRRITTGYNVRKIETRYVRCVKEL